MHGNIHYLASHQFKKKTMCQVTMILAYEFELIFLEFSSHLFLNHLYKKLRGEGEGKYTPKPQN